MAPLLCSCTAPSPVVIVRHCLSSRLTDTALSNLVLECTLDLPCHQQERAMATGGCCNDDTCSVGVSLAHIDSFDLHQQVAAAKIALQVEHGKTAPEGLCQCVIDQWQVVRAAHIHL